VWKSMARRNNRPNGHIPRRSVGNLWYRAVLALLLGALLAGCSEPAPVVPPEHMINVKTELLRDKTVVNVQRADTDSDGQAEWVVFYRFDQVGGQGPVAALIYDMVEDPASQLPIVYPYKLRTPNENYLAQVQPELNLVDLLPETGGIARKELLFKTGKELIFFRLNRDVPNQPSDDPPMYRCIGFFRSEGGVSFDPGTLEVAVTSLSGYERSQLVTRHFYRPEADGYFITGTTTLVSPYASAIDFPHGIPSDILDTPYPEKIVLAFYKHVGQDNSKLAEYLTPQAAKELQEGKLNFGSPWPLDQVKFAVVQELGYYPTQDSSQSTVVTVKGFFRSKSEEKSPLASVRWTMVRVQNRWKMDFPQP